MNSNSNRVRGASSLVFIIVIAVLLLSAAWTWLSLHWSYSDGERAGVLQKFSRKGWLCKTYEGELAQYIVSGVAPQIWNFTVRDEKVAEQMKALVGTKVQLHYTEHRGVPTSCFGDTGYYVEGFTKLDAQAIPGG
ncbi:MAG: hypothetical protein AB7T07_01495 [Steroidobacteraceae bacterium]